MRAAREMLFDRARAGHYHAPAMGKLLNDHGTPKEWARRGQIIDINDNLSILERLVAVVEDEFEALSAAAVPQDWRQLPVTIRLRFHWADAREQVPAAEGLLQATVPMVCQRCLEPFEKALVVPLRLLFVGTGAQVTSTEDYDVWELQDETIRPIDIVEEALVMALPFAAMHESAEDCQYLAPSEQAEAGDAVRPFADLRSQMRDKK